MSGETSLHKVNKKIRHYHAAVKSGNHCFEER